MHGKAPKEPQPDLLSGNIDINEDQPQFNPNIQSIDPYVVSSCEEKPRGPFARSQLGPATYGPKWKPEIQTKADGIKSRSERMLGKSVPSPTDLAQTVS